MGLPFAYGSEASNGCQYGPATIRNISASYNIENHQFLETKSNRQFLSAQDLSDLGDLQFCIQHGTDRYLQTLSTLTASIVENGKPFFYLGGDHLATLGTIQGISKKIDQFQIIHLDAHRDFRLVPEGDLPTHANFMYFVEQLPQVKKVIQLGVRGFETVKYSAQKRVEINNDENWLRNLKEQLIEDCPVFITIDTDAFDPITMPGVNFPVPHGLRPEILSQVFEGIKNKNLHVLGCDWMEYNPEMDFKNKITGH
jgi:agmatinase